MLSGYINLKRFEDVNPDTEEIGHAYSLCVRTLDNVSLRRMVTDARNGNLRHISLRI